MAAERGAHERRDAGEVGEIDVCAFLDQLPGEIELACTRRKVEGRVAEPIARVDVRTLLDQRKDRCLAAISRGEEQFEMDVSLC